MGRRHPSGKEGEKEREREGREGGRERGSQREREREVEKYSDQQNYPFALLHLSSVVSFPHLVPPHKQLGVRVLEEASNIRTHKLQSGHTQREQHGNGNLEVVPFCRIVPSPYRTYMHTERIRERV